MKPGCRLRRPLRHRRQACGRSDLPPIRRSTWRRKCRHRDGRLPLRQSSSRLPCGTQRHRHPSSMRRHERPHRPPHTALHRRRLALCMRRQERPHRPSYIVPHRRRPPRMHHHRRRGPRRRASSLPHHRRKGRHRQRPRQQSRRRRPASCQTESPARNGRSAVDLQILRRERPGLPGRSAFAVLHRFHGSRLTGKSAPPSRRGSTAWSTGRGAPPGSMVRR